MSEGEVVTTGNTSLVVYNPSEIFGMYNDFLARQGGKIICLRGIFHSGTGHPYGSYYYDSISDQYSGQELGIKIPESLRSFLSDGNLVDLAGVIERKLNQKGFIQLTLNVTRSSIVQEQTVSEEDIKRIEIRNRKTERGFKNVDLILESKLMSGERPNVALVFAESSITDSDFNAGKDAASAQMDFSEHRVNFAKADGLCLALQSLDSNGYDAIALIRGGGSGIEHLDDINVLETVSMMDTPVICAIGHVEDKLFIKYISDKVAPTPNGLGAYFKDLVETVSQKRNNSRAVLTKQIESQFKAQIETAKKQNAELQGKIDQLTKNAEAAQKLHKEQIDAANKQNADLQKKIENMNKVAADGQKTTEEQMGKLNSQLAALQKTNKEQSDMFAGQFKTMQENNGKLQQTLNSVNEKNSEYSRKLAESENMCRQLKSELNSSRSGGIYKGLFVATAIALVILLIVLLAG